MYLIPRHLQTGQIGGFIAEAVQKYAKRHSLLFDKTTDYTFSLYLSSFLQNYDAQNHCRLSRP